jgi:radical SAM/Cys-rich protein
MHATLHLLRNTDFPPLQRSRLETLQVNLGYRCNQACLHCHVAAGPTRTEQMAEKTVEDVLAFLARQNIATLDLTGGAPELNPHFRHIVQKACALGIRVIDRCNLTVLEEPGQEDLAAFLARHQVEIIASLPCYLEQNVDRQRGKGVFEASIRALQKLNALGYGRQASQLVLNLVYNPQGPTLPPPQQNLERDYKRHLDERYGITFDHLYTLTNMPIQRFGSMLVSKGQFQQYMALRRGARQDANLNGVMCRTLLSVDWQGYLYDCDFNQMLGIPFSVPGKPKLHISQLASFRLEGNPIAVADHCFGCIAGQGSSCGGALSAA